MPPQKRQRKKKPESSEDDDEEDTDLDRQKRLLDGIDARKIREIQQLTKQKVQKRLKGKIAAAAASRQEVADVLKKLIP